MKKALSLTLAFLMVLTFFSACSKSDKPSTAERELSITFDSHYENINESSRRAYTSLCEAVINGDEQVLFNTAMTEDVNQLYYTSFPLNVLVKSLNGLESGNGLHIEYNNESAEHKKLVEDFTDKVNEIMNSCGFGKVSGDRYVFNLYQYICENIELDETVLSPYDAITTSKGSTQAISQMFEYLVLQGGGKACHITNFDSGANLLSGAMLSGNWYLFCPALEIKNNGGKGLTCFAMSYERAAETMGVSTFEYTDSVELDSDIFSQTVFDELKTASQYTVNGNEITANCNGTQFVLPIK